MLQNSSLRVLLTFGAVAAVAASAAPAAGAAPARVSRVVDGDTIRVRAAAGVRTVDLRGVDAPDAGECFARAAAAQLRRLLPAGTRIALRGSGRRVFVFRRGTFVNQALVRGGYAQWDARGSSRLERRLDRAEDAAIARGRGIWGACQGDEPATEQPAADATPTAPATATQTTTPPPAAAAQTGDAQASQGTRLSASQWTAFVERSVFTTASSSSNFGGSSTQTSFTFCPGRRYAYKSDSFNNGFASFSEEVGFWKFVALARRADLRADEARLELVTTASNASDFDPAAPERERTFTVFLYSYDDGRVGVGNQFAQRAAASTCPNG